jgi:transcriptional regulator with XRE-family HTH domain
MESDPIDAAELGDRVMRRRKAVGMSLRAAAEESGVPFNTLSRVEKGHLPDLANFGRIVNWLGLDPAQFFKNSPRVHGETTPEVIRSSLRADRNLSGDAANKIAQVVEDLYEKYVDVDRDTPVHLRAQPTFTPAAAKLLDAIVSRVHEALLADDAIGANPGWES